MYGMYSTCLFCSASLGRNEAIEAFSVGRTVAFDAWRGRLWAVCRRCGRWNLAPLEERWESVEAADRLFTDTRTRVHSENIGLARLPDGTRLIRVGEALPGELAAWRYGSQLISRRRRNLAFTGLAVVGVSAALVGLPLLASAGGTVAALNIALQASNIYHAHRTRERVVHRVPAGHSPTGAELVVRRMHLDDAVLEPASDGEVGLLLPTPVQLHRWKRPAPGWTPPGAEPLHLGGEEARRVLARAMTDYNARGAKRGDIERALQVIDEAGGADAFARSVAASGAAITRPRLTSAHRSPAPSLRQIAGTFRGEVVPVKKYRNSWIDESDTRLAPTHALALEMALSEQTEREALEGELAALEAAWREAEEIASIADALPDA
jgi:hypothetical protein